MFVAADLDGHVWSDLEKALDPYGDSVMEVATHLAQLAVHILKNTPPG